MNNLQLYRTDILLSGQIKFDIIIKKIGNDIIVDNFNISTIDNLSGYNNFTNKNVLSVPLQTKIQQVYSQISDSFYDYNPNPQLSSMWPIIYSDDNLDPHEGIFERGCKRMSYSKYNTQFEFFTPLWLENISKDDEISFKIDILSLNKNVIYTDTLSLTKKGYDFHDKFIDYLYNYFQYIGIDTGNDDVMSVDLYGSSAHIKGLDVSTGLLQNINIPSLVSNLTSRERPLMEFDNMLIENFKNYHIIATQLMNLNICFNISDIIPEMFCDMMKGGQFYIDIETYINSKGEKNILEKKDFFSNYDFIKKIQCGPTNIIDMYVSKSSEDSNKIISNEINVLNYLRDYDHIDLINKNKIIQNIIHWSLVDNNEYILNTYEGFSGYSVDDNGNIINHSRLYNNTPDLLNKEYFISLNNTGWANLTEFIKTQDSEIFEDLIKHNLIDLKGKKSAWITFASDTVWVNNIKYNVLEDTDKTVDIAIIYNNISGHTCSNWWDEGFFGEDITNNSINICKDNLYFTIEHVLNGYYRVYIYSDNISYLTFANVLNILKDIYKENNILQHIYKFMLSVDNSSNPNIITIGSGIGIMRADSPSLKSSEITYYKVNNFTNNILRYSGKIKPTFISPDDIYFNYIYYKKIIQDYKLSKFFKYYSTKYTPTFPSLGYYSFDKEKLDYNNPLWDFAEYSWYDTNKIYILTPEIHTTLFSSVDSEGNYISIKTLIYQYIKNYYNLYKDEDYIFSLYDYKISYDYVYKEDGKSIAVENDKIKYKYDVYLTLK